MIFESLFLLVNGIWIVVSHTDVVIFYMVLLALVSRIYRILEENETLNNIYIDIGMFLVIFHYFIQFLFFTL